jgi:hypothetical protein
MTTDYSTYAVACEYVLMEELEGKEFSEDDLLNAIHTSTTDYLATLTQEQRTELLGHIYHMEGGMEQAYQYYQQTQGEYTGDDLESALLYHYLHKGMTDSSYEQWKEAMVEWNEDQE